MNSTKLFIFIIYFICDVYCQKTESLNSELEEIQVEIPKRCPFAADHHNDRMSLAVEVRQNDKNGNIIKIWDEDKPFIYEYSQLERGLPGFNRVFKDMCVFEIREFRVPNDPYWTKSLHSDMLKEKAPDAKYFYFRVELVELTKGRNLNQMNGGEGFGNNVKIEL